MKKTLLTFLLFIFSIYLYPQFSDALGNSSSLSGTLKTIKEGKQKCTPKAWPKRWKFDRSGRRYKFRAHMYDNCAYTADDLDSTNGWNKIGRITFPYDTPNLGKKYNIFKMHLGWIFRDDPNTISFALFFHNNKEAVYAAHKIDERGFTDANSTIDMYLGQRVIGMIINNEQDPDYDIKCIGIRQDNSEISVAKNSFVSKAFYFGGNSVAPHKMEVRFHDQRVDDAGYQTKFNSSDIMTWNISEFIDSDNFSYTASKTINGSVVDDKVVQYHGDHPNKIFQRCIIHDGASISFTAGEKVHLYPGFHAKPGSYFRAAIEPPAKININRIPQQFDEQISYGVENVKSVEFSLYYDKTLDSLVYGKQSYVVSTTATVDIDTILPLDKYYAVADFYSGKGSQKRVEGWVNNLNYGLKQNITDVGSPVISSDYSIYPNPSSGVFNMKVNSPEFIISLEVINSYGQSVLIERKPNSAEIVIDISNQAKGMYILLVQTNAGVETYKLLKN